MNKHVQQISGKCEQLPERYIRKQAEEYGGNLTNAHDTTAEIPVIDFSLLATSSLSELDKLKSLVTTWGCFQTINHGIESSLLDKVREIGIQFFELPVEEKKKCLREKDDVEGYGNDMVLSNNQILDWNDRIYLTVIPLHQQKLQFWPQNPTHFREVLNEYSSKIDLISKVVLKSLARSLNLEEDSFLNQYGTTADISARYNYYPPCPWPEKVLGVKAHADSSAITVLLQDKEVEGLQLLRDNQWVGVPIVRDALTINVGDQMEVQNPHAIKYNGTIQGLKYIWRTEGLCGMLKEMVPIVLALSQTLPSSFLAMKRFLREFCGSSDSNRDMAWKELLSHPISTSTW